MRRSSRPLLSTLGLVVWLAILTLVGVSTSARGGDSAGPLRSFLAVRGDQVLIAESPDQLVSPASVLKLVVAAAALHHLGPTYRATTVARIEYAAQRGVVNGDLVIDAAADPTWNQRFFPDRALGPVARLAQAIAARGIVRVAGDLVVDVSGFPGPAQPFDRALAEMALAYAAPTSGLAIDENAVKVRIAPGSAVGAAGSVAMTRGRAGAPTFHNEIRTVGRERHDRGTVAFRPLWDAGDILVRGEYPISEPPYEMAVSVPRPSWYAGNALKAALAEQGVAVAGRVRVSETPIAGSVALARIDSPPLADWLGPILSESHNWYAEMLFRHIARHATGEGRIAEGLAAINDFMAREIGVPPGATVLADGSGLSADNLITARAVVSLLSWVRNQPWHAAFVSSLAVPGRGTLAAWGALPPIAAKTGSRRHVVALAGYLNPLAEEPVVFALLFDHVAFDKRVARRQIVERLRILDDRQGDPE